MQGKASFKQLDNQVARLAVKLPNGDLDQQSRAVASCMGGGTGLVEDEEDEDELR
jgi:hypothetical protein